MKIGFILLAHEHPKALKPLFEALLASGSDLYVHYDLNAKHDLISATNEWQLDQYSGKVFFAQRTSVAWGEWSIVQGTLNCLDIIEHNNYDCDYYYLLSGSCMPIKPIKSLTQFLDQNKQYDFIEAVNAEDNIWVKGGIQNERWEYKHYFNYRFEPNLFSISLWLQKKLSNKATLPLDHTPYIGSQWWCLRKETIIKVKNLLNNHPIINNFYRFTCIPDEHYFQTLVANIINAQELNNNILTRYTFNSHGIPRVYYNDDIEELMADTCFFARKISPQANDLKSELYQISKMNVSEFTSHISNTEIKETLSKKLDMHYVFKKQSWYTNTLLNQDKYDIVKNTPNKIIALLSDGHDKELEKHIENSVTLMNLPSNNWYHTIAKFCFDHPDKTIIIPLSNQNKEFMNTLRWKARLLFIYIEGTKPSPLNITDCSISDILDIDKQANESVKTLAFIKSNFYEEKSYCQFLRITELNDDTIQTVKTIVHSL